MKCDKKIDENDLQKELSAPYTYLVQIQGNVLFTEIFMSFKHWLNVPDDVVLKVLETMTILINGVFLIDDIQDNSLVRRGVPTAQCMYGMPLTLNTGIQAITEVMQKVLNLVPNGLGGTIFADNFSQVWVGQGTEIYWRDNFICPTEESYRKMHLQKTGSFIKMGVKLLQALSDNKEDYDYIVQLLGYYSQLRDDYCNLRAKELNQDSSFCSDFTEGKFTLPIIHASKTSAGHEVLPFEGILRQRTSDVKLKKYCLSLLEEAGSLQYTRDRLSELDREARAEVSRLGGNPLLESVLDELNSWKDDRMLINM